MHPLLALVQARLQPFNLFSLCRERVVERRDLGGEVGVEGLDAGAEVSTQGAGVLGEGEEAVDGGNDVGDALENRVVGIVEATGRGCGEGGEGGEGTEEVSDGRLAG